MSGTLINTAILLQSASVTKENLLREKGPHKATPFLPPPPLPCVCSVHFYVPKNTCHMPCLFPERHGKMNRLQDHSYTPAHPTPAPPGSTTPQSDCCKYCCTVCNQILLSSKALPAAPSPPRARPGNLEGKTFKESFRVHLCVRRYCIFL